MLYLIKSHINLELLSGAFSSRALVRRFAAKVIISCILIANIVDMTSLAILHHFDMLPYSLSKAIHTGLLMTTTISVAVGLPILYVICLAIHELSLSRDEFARLSRTDALTGLLNRRAFLEVLETSSGDVSFVLFDIDRFKSVNDTYGHNAGDRAIVCVAQTLQDFFGPGSAVGRMGGEEFAILVAGESPAARFVTTDQARAVIADRPIELDDGRTIQITVSGGIADMADHQGFGSIFAAADKALYVAKISGRNRVIDHRDIPHFGLAPVTQPDNNPATQTAFGL